MTSTPADFFGPIIGPQHVLTAPEDTARYYQDWRGRVTGYGRGVLRPENAEQISQIIKICRAENIAIVPQGGNTGLVGGSIPYADHPAIVISLERMNRLRQLDPISGTMIVESGCVLAAARQYAAVEGWELPISMGSEGTSQIGGVISTNAGGILTVGYGNAREQVLGLEVVLADGKIWHGLNALRKNNTGYDLKHLFIGAEGTLGIITAASMMLTPLPSHYVTALVALHDVHQALNILQALRRIGIGTLRAVEIMSARCLDFAVCHIPDIRIPMEMTAPWYMLVEFGLFDDRHAEQVHEILAQIMTDWAAADIVLAGSETQRQTLWRLREAIVEAQKHEGGSIKHDIALPISQIPDFIDQLEQVVERLIPGARPVIFGHLGDGNLHANISQPVGADKALFMSKWDMVTNAVHRLAVHMGGTFSAEHGIGRFKTNDMRVLKDDQSYQMMRRLKRTLDPAGLFNPGVMFR